MLCCIYTSTAAKGLHTSKAHEFEQITSYVISSICFLTHVWYMEAKRLQLELSFRSELMVNLEH